MRGRVVRSLLVLGAILTLAPSIWAQEPTGEAGVSGILLHRELATAIPQLRRAISVRLEGASLKDALRTVAREADLPITYNDAILPKDRRVWLTADDIRTDQALEEILRDSGLQLLPLTTGQVVVIKTRAKASVTVQEGTIVGRVTDKGSKGPLVGATVAVEGTRHGGTTDEDGRYQIKKVPAGTHTIRARYIGYSPATAPVTVSAGQEATADFALEKSAQRLDEVVTTGTVLPTEVKALPTPISVLTKDDIERQRPQTVQQLFRQAVPTAVSWDQANNPYYTAFSVRGASTLVNQAGQMKVLLDGIEVALPAVASLDLNSIERVEVIRGPQAAGIYGSDAIGGVIQISTKRGQPNVARPQIDGRVALGIIQTPYDGFGGVLRQNYAASVHGGGTDVSYNLGGGYSHTGDWLPNGELSQQSNPSVYGGMHFGHGVIAVDLSGRYYTQNNPAVANPGLSATGLSFFVAPVRQHQQVQNHTVGARLGIAPTPWWQNTISLGIDRYTLDDFNTGPRFTYPGDTLLLVLNQNRTKTSIGYNTSVHGSWGNALSGSLTAGFDHYSLPATQFISIGALNTTGAIRTDPNLPFSVSRTVTNNTGVFTQAQLGYHDALFLTAGLRAEKNSDFGDSLGTPVSPQGGVTYVHQLGGATYKLRGSWGRAIRPPAPGLKFATPGGVGAITLPNPVLGPERQQGWDAGIDGAFGRYGLLSFTFYKQIAEDLIQSVSLPSDSVPTTQNQNVGRVENTGIEIEGTLFIGMLTLKAQYGYARSRIEQLAPGYTGDLQVGDQALATPKHTAGAALTFAPPTGTTLTAGLAYVGSWRNYDYFAQFSCYGGTGPCQASNRDYIVSYPGFVRLSAGVSQQLTSLLSAFAQVDNLTNNAAFELDDLSPVMGRITTLGFQLRY